MPMIIRILQKDCTCPMCGCPDVEIQANLDDFFRCLYCNGCGFWEEISCIRPERIEDTL